MSAFFGRPNWTSERLTFGIMHHSSYTWQVFKVEHNDSYQDPRSGLFFGGTPLKL